MQINHLIIILLSFIFASLQVGFLPNYSFFGAVPNLVFVLFFLVIFFSNEKYGLYQALYSLFFGILIDMFSNPYKFIGVYLILFLIMGFALKKLQRFFFSSFDRFPLDQFIFLFLFFCAIFEFTQFEFLLSNIFWLTIACSFVFSLLGFYIFKSKYAKEI